MTGRVALVVAPLAMAVALAACGSTEPSAIVADGEWSAPSVVVRDTVSWTAAPRIAAGGGQVAVTREWEAPGNGVRVFRLGGNGRWSAPERIPAVDPVWVQIGADSLGRLVLAWSAYHPDFPGFRCAWAATSSAAGAWSASRSLACGVQDVRVAVGPSGHALVVWSWSRQRGLAGAPYDPAAGWQDGYGFANPDREVPSFDAAVDADGLGAVTWHGAPEGTDQVHIAFAREGRQLHATQLGPDLSSPADPRVAFESAGTAVAAWASDRGIVATTTSPIGGVTARITDDPNDTCADAAGSGRGMALLSWSRRFADPGVFAATHVLGSQWAPHDVQRAPPMGPLCPVLEMDAQGNAVAAWTLQGPAGFDPEIWASIRPAATGRWTAPRRLAAEAVEPAVAIAGGVAYVVWRAHSGDLIQESRLRFEP